MKRWLMIISVGFVVLVAGAWVWAKSQKTTTPPAQTSTVKVDTKAKPWDGVARRDYDVTFIHSGQVLDLSSIGYTGLDHASANVYIVITTPKSSPQTPVFARSTTFQLSSPTGHVWLPQVTTVALTGNGGAFWKVTVKFRGVPTSFLGQGQLTLAIAKPGGKFALSLIPPPAPAGHRYAEVKPVVKPKPKPKAHKKAKLALCKKGHRSTHAHPCRKR
jgi:hypothetical protein